MIDEGKLNNFLNGIVNNYNENNIIKKIFKTHNLPALDISDETEDIKLPLEVGERYFMPGSTNFHIHSIGRQLAFDEFKLFYDGYSKTKLREIKIPIDELTTSFINDKLNNFDNTVIISSSKIRRFLSSNKENIRLFNEDYGVLYYMHTEPWYKVSNSLLPNKIMIFDKSDIFWTYGVFDNDETIDIQHELIRGAINLYLKSSVYLSIEDEYERFLIEVIEDD